MISITKVNNHFIKPTAPTKFYIKTNKNYSPNISKFSPDNPSPIALTTERHENTEVSYTEDYETDTKGLLSTDNLPPVHLQSSVYILQNEDTSEEIIEYDAAINAFCHCPFRCTNLCCMWNERSSSNEILS